MTKSDTNQAFGELPEKLMTKIQKLTSAKLTFAHFKEDKIIEAHHPTMVKESKEAVDNEQVDVKVDNFINRFKHPLMLQMLDSIMRYKDMISK
ncbi:Pathogen-associated molecular patterns-induced protein A70 [Camellia lanceoleosa]|uniref:Pathogen-associated molecular patterns-induced protein A70 n=1 Tax=Camellia lanceoleosa TaxID=1840588 RepID=A0ACC0IFR4_9ERIC|nr:Pathogen-associated molecular patterns-induced protein A70 [Camellia lanceoleosa]